MFIYCSLQIMSLIIKAKVSSDKYQRKRKSNYMYIYMIYELEILLFEEGHTYPTRCLPVQSQ